MRVYRAVLIVLILMSHFLIRDSAARMVPLNARGNYPEEYGVAISLAFGKGFHALSQIQPFQPNTGLLIPEAPEARPLVRFLRWGQDSLSPNELEAYFRTVYSPTAASPLASTRILELRVAGVLWKIFGVRWSTVFHFYSIVSAFVCLLIFLIARRLSGSYWAGCLAAIIYLLSPQEIKFGIISIRDVSPFWFGSIAFFWLIVLTDRSRSALWNFASIVALGGVSLLGYGWRTDALLLPPFIFAVLISWLVHKGRGLRYATMAGLCFVAGCGATMETISALGSAASSASPNIFFEVANYGQFTRSNLFHLENSFQIPRNDFETFALTNFRWSLQHPTEPLPSYLSDRYGIASRELYWAYLKYNVFNWYWEFPAFYVTTLRDVALPKQFMVAPPSILLVLSVAIPIFFIGGALPIIFLSTERWLTSALYFFSVYYSAIFLLVLPEEKHLCLLLLPFSVLGGITGWVFLRTTRSSGLFSDLVQRCRRSARITALAIFCLFGIWGLGLAGSYSSSKSERNTYLHDISALAAQQSQNSERTLRNRRGFSATVGAETAPRGILLKIRAGQHPGILEVVYSRDGEQALANLDLPFVTRHRLYPNKEQFYFATLVPGKVVNDRGDYRCIVTLRGDAEFVYSEEIDLSAWKHPAFNTVFYEGENIAGSPPLDSNTASTDYVVATPARSSRVASLEVLSRKAGT